MLNLYTKLSINFYSIFFFSMCANNQFSDIPLSVLSEEKGMQYTPPEVFMCFYIVTTKVIVAGSLQFN